MRDLVKKWWLWAIIVLIVIIIVFMITSFKNTNKNVGTAGISKEEYEQIKLGMGQGTVNSIIDMNDEWEDDKIYEKCCQEISKSNDGRIYKYVYKYLGEKDGYAIITFEADYSKGDLFVLPTVTSKEQFNLK